MKNKKLLIGAGILGAAAVLASCGACGNTGNSSIDMAYVDSNGQTVDVKVEATEDSEAVAQAIEAIEYGTSTATGVDLTKAKIYGGISADGSFTGTYSGSTVSGSGEINLSGNAIYSLPSSITKTSDLWKNLGISAEVSGSGNYSITGSNPYITSGTTQKTAMTGSVSADAHLYADTEKLYVDDTLNGTPFGNEAQTYKGFINKSYLSAIASMYQITYTAEEYAAVYQALQNFKLDDLGGLISGETTTVSTSQRFIPIDFEELKSFIEQYGVSISSVQDGKINFKVQTTTSITTFNTVISGTSFAFSNDVAGTFEINLTFDTNTYLPCYISAKGTNVTFSEEAINDIVPFLEMIPTVGEYVEQYASMLESVDATVTLNFNVYGGIELGATPATLSDTSSYTTDIGAIISSMIVKK